MVTWIQEYLVKEHGETQANKILDDIDQRYVNQNMLYMPQAHLTLELQLSLHFWDCASSPKDGALNSGLAMIQRL